MSLHATFFIQKCCIGCITFVQSQRGIFPINLLIACTERLPCPSATRPLSEVEGQGPRSRRVAEVFIGNCYNCRVGNAHREGYLWNLGTKIDCIEIKIKPWSPQKYIGGRCPPYSNYSNNTQSLIYP